jgi:hypothetical protein
MSTNQAENRAPNEAPTDGQTTTPPGQLAAGHDPSESSQKRSHERMRRIGMKLFGPADSGPYGPPTEPPAPRPRDRWGHPLKDTKAD